MQVSVLEQSVGRVSSSSEQLGAVQQEARVSIDKLSGLQCTLHNAQVATAIEILLLHVDNLRRSYEREHSELEEVETWNHVRS